MKKTKKLKNRSQIVLDMIRYGLHSQQIPDLKKKRSKELGRKKVRLDEE